jgi:uncharacterized SAM-binding protein YcdF (DUF218 family)
LRRTILVFTFLPQSKRVRGILAALAGIFVVAAGYGVVHLGTFMAREDPLVHADAIFVLAGTHVERPLEAADLYGAGYAPRVLLTRSMAEGDAYAVARARGARLSDEFDSEEQVLMQLGVPEMAIVALSRTHDNTAQEATTLREVALRERWTRVIVVSSKYHLRRTRLACRRALAGTPVEIVMRGSRYDPSDPDHWWRHRGDIRWLISEVPKLVLYASGMGG